MIARLAAPLLALLVCIAPVHAAGPPIDPTDVTFTWPQAVSKAGAKAKGVGKLKIGGVLAADVSFGAEQTFSATLDGTSVTGTWSRKKPNSKRLDLVLDAPSVVALAQRYEDDLELFSPIPIDTELTLDTDKTKLAVVIASKKKAGTMTAKLVVKLRFVGVTDGNGKSGAPTKVKARLKGKSEPQPLP